MRGNILASVTYVGSKGTHLTAQRELNQLLPVPGPLNPFGPNEPFLSATCLFQPNQTSAMTGFSNGAYTLPSGHIVYPTDPVFTNLQTACFGNGAGGRVDPNSSRQFAPGLGQIYSLQNVANSAYSALQLSLRRTAGPLNLGFAYTYSHSIDDASDRSDATFTNSFDLRSARASSNFDQRQLLHISYVYPLPLTRLVNSLADWAAEDPDDGWKSNRPASAVGSSQWSKTLLAGWELSGITLFETGIPFTVVNGGSPNGVSVLDNAGVYNGLGAGSYPDRVPHFQGRLPKVPGGGSNVGPLLLNPGIFTAPRGLTFGNAGRNSLNNPQRWNFDAALLKEFILPGEAHLEFRAESFNLFNHTQFRVYNPTLGNQANNTVSCDGPPASTGEYSAGDPGDGASRIRDASAAARSCIRSTPTARAPCNSDSSCRSELSAADRRLENRQWLLASNTS